VDEALLGRLVKEGLTLREIAARTGVSPTTVRYWIAKLELPRPSDVRRARTAERIRAGETREVRRCPRHGEAHFAMDANGTWRCLECRRHAVAERRRKVKRTLVEEAGGECTLCGYRRSFAALQFHHIDPGRKSFGIAQKGRTSAIDALREEAAKCVLLCANCHVEVEVGVSRLPTTSG
jgi:hypothetical protein